MKVRILTVALILALLVDAGGIVFLCLYVSTLSKIKAVKHELRVVKNNLTMQRSTSNNSSFGGPIQGPVPIGEANTYPYVSQATGKEDLFLVSPARLPDPVKDQMLIVYLHGMNSSYQEPFVRIKKDASALPLIDRYPHTLMVSCNYGGDASWGNKDGMSDITQNIRFLLQQYPIKKIIMLGNSMGGCVSLSYAVNAPADIKDKIVGIISSESSGDLAKLFDETKNAPIKMALVNAFGGLPTQVPQVYAAQSFIPNIDKLPAAVNVSIISASQDDMIPPELQRDLISALDEHHIPHKLFKFDGKHGIPPTDTYIQAYDFALGRDTDD